MISENDDSRSSARMAPLRQWQETARLGQLIVHELNLQNTNKVLGRWMSYRVAELMQRAESAADESVKEAAERECQDLIIRLWENRDNWPSGGPLHSLMPTLQILLADEPPFYPWIQRTKEDNTSGLITRLLKLQREELQQIYQLIKDRLPADVIDSMQGLLNNHLDDLSEDESSLISFVVRPSNMPVFNSEEAVEDWDENEESVEGNNVEEEETSKTASDELDKFRKSIDLKRNALFEAVARVLAND